MLLSLSLNFHLHDRRDGSLQHPWLESSRGLLGQISIARVAPFYYRDERDEDNYNDDGIKIMSERILKMMTMRIIEMRMTEMITSTIMERLAAAESLA